MSLDANTHLQPEKQSPFASQVFLYSRNPREWQDVIDKAASDPRITAGIGIPPWEEGDINQLRLLLETHPNLQLGEIGLDRRFYKTMPRPSQVELLKTQLLLAKELNRSTSIHCVQAWGTLCELLEALEKGNKLPHSTIHAWSGSQEILQRLLKLPLMFSMGNIQTANPNIPLPPPERLFWESDDGIEGPQTNPANRDSR